MYITNLNNCIKMVKVKLSLCLSDEALCHEDVWGSDVERRRYFPLLGL
jgi:hypothetical protein